MQQAGQIQQQPGNQNQAGQQNIMAAAANVLIDREDRKAKDLAAWWAITIAFCTVDDVSRYISTTFQNRKAVPMDQERVSYWIICITQGLGVLSLGSILGYHMKGITNSRNVQIRAPVAAICVVFLSSLLQLIGNALLLKSLDFLEDNGGIKTGKESMYNNFLAAGYALAIIGSIFHPFCTQTLLAYDTGFFSFRERRAPENMPLQQGQPQAAAQQPAAGQQQAQPQPPAQQPPAGQALVPVI